MKIVNLFSKLLFPFVVKYKGLNKFWWNRLFLAMFIILILATLVFVWISLNNEQYKGYEACVYLSSYSEGSFDGCSEIYKIHSGYNFLMALVVALVASYLIQIIYYKVILYIIFGKKLADFKHAG